ncbi:hypothetical protein [Sinorhizobium meliloti]|uniref:hypothetical protein n=1 Tax=Rhizobium meliloti TaxID=382 RepID=UPI000FDB329B|nr:hypothetical protein [Sinorhizobium meliloti]MDW9377917.1 hypothetical protein [Sinorhizobium meliloti]MDW9496359.1 hypothetical protein [Sinorhizobium meliloti]MDW9564839.1 hypothetical protein [Sinorhizobium meliloti]MDW9652300.1 hypothetical protein [Sinorhizobium meliloti]MDW9862673.1 hypothetical protein [Sinorhizobium meliloti]
MTYEELIDLLISRNALIVHCSRPGKGDEGPNSRLFPDDLRDAIAVCESGAGDLSCSLVWPGHSKTFGSVGIMLKPRSIASISSAHPTDAGTSPDANGRRTGFGGRFSREAVMDTFANLTDYNEWTMTDADTIGLFVNLQESPLEVAKVVDLTQLPDYNAAMPPLAVLPQPITLDEVRAAFPDLPIRISGNGDHRDRRRHEEALSLTRTSTASTTHPQPALDAEASISNFNLRNLLGV